MKQENTPEKTKETYLLVSVYSLSFNLLLLSAFSSIALFIKNKKLVYSIVIAIIFIVLSIL